MEEQLTVSCFADVLGGILEFHEPLLVRCQSLELRKERKTGIRKSLAEKIDSSFSSDT